MTIGQNSCPRRAAAWIRLRKDGERKYLTQPESWRLSQVGAGTARTRSRRTRKQRTDGLAKSARLVIIFLERMPTTHIARRAYQVPTGVPQRRPGTRGPAGPPWPPVPIAAIRACAQLLPTFDRAELLDESDCGHLGPPTLGDEVPDPLDLHRPGTSL